MPRFTARSAHWGLLLLCLALPACEKEPAAPPAWMPQKKSKAEQQKDQEFRLLAALKLKPDRADLRLSLANLYYDLGRNSEAAEHYRLYLLKMPDQNNARCDLGTALKRQGHLLEARGEYETVLRKNPRHANAQHNLAIVLDLLADHAKAAEAWEKFAKLAPTDKARQDALKSAAAARKRANK